MIIILVGIALGMFIHVGVSGNLGFQGCGTPWRPGFVTPVREDFAPASPASPPTITPGLCAEARQSRGLIAVGLIVLGVIVAAASLV